MDQENNNRKAGDATDDLHRRDVVRKLGKFAAYAAPFTVLALKGNADAGGHGSGGLGTSVSPSGARR